MKKVQGSNRFPVVKHFQCCFANQENKVDVI